MSLPSEGQSLSANQISSRYLHWLLRYTISGFEIQTSAILEFYFRFRSRPVRRNLYVFLHQAAKFRSNRITHCQNMTSYPFLKMAAATAMYYFRFPTCRCHCLQKVQVYQQIKFCQDTSIGGWDISTSDFEIKTYTILEFYFRFRSRPVRRNMHVFLYQATEFRPNRSPHCGNMTSYTFLKMGGRDRKILLPVSYLLISLSSEGQIWSISKPNFVKIAPLAAEI